MTQWQPIETAPKDGTPVLISGRKFKRKTRYVAIAKWTTRHCPAKVTGWFPREEDKFADYVNVTRWKPLSPPTPPAPIEKGE